MEKKYLGCNLSLGLFSWREWGGGGSFLEAIFPRGNYVGNKSSKKQFSSGAISRGILSGGNFFWVIFWEQSSRGQLFGGNFPRGQLSGGQSSRGRFSREHLSGGQFSSGAVVLELFRSLQLPGG